MNIQKLPLSRIKPAPYNPRVTLKPGDPRFEKLARSLAEFDLVQPLVWNRRTGHLVGGHQRLEILRHQGASEVDCVVVDLPLPREQALNIALNNSEVGGDWDPGSLSSLLTELEDLPDFDPTLTGFDEQQLRDLLFVPTDEEFDDDEGDEESGLLTIRVEFPPNLRGVVEASLNGLLARAPGVRVHGPQGG